VTKPLKIVEQKCNICLDLKLNLKVAMYGEIHPGKRLSIF